MSAVLVLAAAGCDGHDASKIPFADPEPTGLGSLTRGLGFTAGPSMNVARVDFASVRLVDNRLLVTGGFDGTNILSSCEIYDFPTNTWTSTGQMSVARRFHTATLRSDGKVLVAGGETAGGTLLDSAEVFDPATGGWTPTAGKLTTARKQHAALQLSGTWILVSGGEGAAGTLASAEVYDPGANGFRATGAMLTPRRGHFIANVSADAVVIAGWNGTTVLASAERYATSTEAWKANGGLKEARGDFAGFAGYQGGVFLSGGTGTGGEVLATNEYYGMGGTSESKPMLNSPRRFHALVVQNGSPWVAGGEGAGGAILSSTELFLPSDGSWRLMGSMTGARVSPGGTALDDSYRIMLFGGRGTGVLGSSEVFDARIGGWLTSGAMTELREVAVRLKDGRILAMGGLWGSTSGTFSSTAEVYDPATGVWTPTAPMNHAHQAHGAVTLKDGRVLVDGGNDPGGSGGYGAELFDPATGTWSVTGSASLSTWFPKLVLLNNGKVLSCCHANSAQLYDPATGWWSTTGSTNVVKGGAALLLPTGEVLFVNDDTYPSVAELYDPDKGTWSMTGPMNWHHGGPGLLVLKNGLVLAAGDGSELYDRSNDVWTKTGSMIDGIQQPVMVQLSSGKVLAIEGTRDTSFRPVSSKANLYDPISGLWWSAWQMANPHQALFLQDNGEAFALGGIPGGTASVVSEIYSEIVTGNDGGDGGSDGSADAGQTDDTGSDGGVEVDAGVEADTGVETDAGVEIDTGVEADAGIESDGGAARCIPGSKSCWSGSQRSVCKFDGTGWDTFDCAAGETCVGGECVTISIDAGALTDVAASTDATPTPDALWTDAGADKSSSGCGCTTVGI